MVKKIIPSLFISGFLAGCSSLKPLQFTNNNQVNVSASATAPANKSNINPKNEVKFLEDISVEPGQSVTNTTFGSGKASFNDHTTGANVYLTKTVALEKASELQLKYAILLNTEVEQLQNNLLLEYIDEWYGTRYRYGGTSKKGVDCSAFTQAIYLAAFAVSLPRTARDQYRNSKIISATEMKTGDLVFFNTTGGISHVGIYLQNNKFVHASSAYGVTISDMFDPYYLRRFIGVGRVEKPGAMIN